jgi:hypothetical protein
MGAKAAPPSVESGYCGAQDSVVRGKHALHIRISTGHQACVVGNRRHDHRILRRAACGARGRCRALSTWGGAPPKVNQADPPSATQDTTLDVHVLGSGFDDGSSVAFTINGVPRTKVHTNSVTFVSGTELIPYVTVDLDAVADLYDVEVVTARGKKGVGADLLTVVEKSK